MRMCSGRTCGAELPNDPQDRPALPAVVGRGTLSARCARTSNGSPRPSRSTPFRGTVHIHASSNSIATALDRLRDQARVTPLPEFVHGAVVAGLTSAQPLRMALDRAIVETCRVTQVFCRNRAATTERTSEANNESHQRPLG